MRRIKSINATDNILRGDVSLIIGDRDMGYLRGDLLDANAIIQLVKTLMSAGGLITIGSETIEDGSIREEDLSPELIETIASGKKHTYDENDESLRIS